MDSFFEGLCDLWERLAPCLVTSFLFLGVVGVGWIGLKGLAWILNSPYSLGSIWIPTVFIWIAIATMSGLADFGGRNK